MSDRHDMDAADGAEGAGQPRYRQIYGLLRNRIGDGHYPIGSHLPTEVELCAEFGVSRYTIREALRRLVDQGMLSRRQGSGSAVVAQEPQHNFVHHVRSLADLFQYALDTHLEVRSIEHVDIDAELADALEAEAGSRWIRVRGLRLTRRGGEPICVTHSYIPERFSWIEPELPSCVGPFYALLEARSGEAVSNATQEIKAEPMPPAVAETIGAEPGTFALRLLRRYASRRGTLIASFNWHPADIFTYRMHLQRNPAQ